MGIFFYGFLPWLLAWDGGKWHRSMKMGKAFLQLLEITNVKKYLHSLCVAYFVDDTNRLAEHPVARNLSLARGREYGHTPATRSHSRSLSPPPSNRSKKQLHLCIPSRKAIWKLKHSQKLQEKFKGIHERDRHSSFQDVQ